MPDADYGGGNYNSGYGSGGTSTTGSTTTGGTTTGGTTTGGTTTGGSTDTGNNNAGSTDTGTDTANNGDTGLGGFEGGNTSGLGSSTDTSSPPSLSGGIGGLVGAATGGNLDTNSLAGLANWSGPSSTPAPDDNTFGPRSDTGFGGWDTMSDMSGPIGITGDLSNVTGQPGKIGDQVGDYVGGPSIGYSMDEASADWGYGVDRALTNMQTANALGEDISSVADDPGIMGTSAARQFPAAGTTGTAMTGFSPQVGLPGPADWADALYGDPVLGGLATPTGVPGVAGPTQHPQFAGNLDQPVGQPYSNWDLSPALDSYAQIGAPVAPMSDTTVTQAPMTNFGPKTDMEQPNQVVEQNGIFNKDQSRIVTRADGTSIEVPHDAVANPSPEVKAALDAWQNPAVFTGPQDYDIADAVGQPYGITDYPTSYPSYDAPADRAIPDIEPPPDFEPNPGYTDPNVKIATKVPPQIVPPDDFSKYLDDTDGIYQRPGWIAQNGGLNVQAASADPDNRNDTGGGGDRDPDGAKGLDWLFKYYGRQPGYQTVVPTQANVRMAPISQGMGTLLRRVQIQNI